MKRCTYMYFLVALRRRQISMVERRSFFWPSFPRVVFLPSSIFWTYKHTLHTYMSCTTRNMRYRGGMLAIIVSSYTSALCVLVVFDWGQSRKKARRKLSLLLVFQNYTYFGSAVTYHGAMTILLLNQNLALFFYGNCVQGFYFLPVNVIWNYGITDI